MFVLLAFYLYSRFNVSCKEMDENMMKWMILLTRIKKQTIKNILKAKSIC